MIIKKHADWEKETPQLLADLREFCRIMKRRPFANYEGLRGVSAFALYYFTKKIQPTAIFEVGVWKGFSTWILEQAAPEAEIYCFDPMFFLEHLIDPAKVGEIYRPPKAHYFKLDEFSCADLKGIVANTRRAMAFFDDHQNKMPRLLQSKAFGIKDIVFDDNMPFHYTHRSFEQDRQSPETLAAMEREIANYEVFPTLWPFESSDFKPEKDGLCFPVDDETKDIYEERGWHSFVTYTRLL
jgi:hypothetical protein